MRVLVTGSSGHLGEALVRTLQNTSHEVVGLDVVASHLTREVGSILDRSCVKRCMKGVDALHTAALHKPHVITHGRQDFVDINVAGTLNLLEEAASVGVDSFVFTSTTSTFGAALTPLAGAPAVWVTEDVTSVPKNIYGVTKIAAENLCQLFHRDHGLACLVLRTSRFFPEEDDCAAIRQAYEDDNVKANEYLYQRVDLEDVVSAHLLALERAPSIGFGRYIVTATTPFLPDDLFDLRVNAPLVVRRESPGMRPSTRVAVGKCSPTLIVCMSTKRREETWTGSPAMTLIMYFAGYDPRRSFAAQRRLRWVRRAITLKNSQMVLTPWK